MTTRTTAAPAPIEVRKNERELIRLETSEFNGRRIAQLRVWYDDGSGTFRPGRSGIAFRIDLLPEVAEALAALERQARQAGLLR